MSIPRLQLRRDLIMRRIALRDRCVWVLKDPLSTTFHFFDEAEFAILRRLRDGGSFTTLSGVYRDRLPPTVLAEFLSAATRAGILTTPGGIPASPAWRTARPLRHAAWWKNPLAIRLPGITPHRLGIFTRTHQQTVGGANVVQNGLSKIIIIAVVASVCLALVILGLHQQDLIDDFAAAGSRLVAPMTALTSPVARTTIGSTLLVFGIAIAVTKVVHELAHAWVCQRLGGRCREIGVLLLFGIPCLYCDVSDAWLMPRRRDRILVSAAGVIAEWIVAAVAVIVWASTRPGLLHDVSALIVVVASVSTFVVNANPLLRYDGYYILSDAAGVPNLAAEANFAMRQTWAKWTGASGKDASSPRTWLVVYGIASNLYRLFVLGVIGWAAFSYLSVSIGYGAALPITLVLSFVVLRQRFRNLLASGPRGDAPLQDRWRGKFVTGAIVLSLLLLVSIPLPHGLRVGCLIRPLGERPIFAANSGIILTRESETAVRLDDWRLRLKELASRGRIAELQSELAALRIDRIDRPAMSLIQPILANQITRERENHATLARRLDQLTLTIDPEEKLFAPPPRRVSRRERIVGRWGWTGTPLEPGNVGATLAQGTLVGRAGSPNRRTASLYVPEQSIDEVRLGQTVTLGYRGLPSGSIRGQVESLSADPVDSVPDEILTAGWINANGNERGGTIPTTVHYEVIVMLDNNDADVVLPPRIVTPAIIEFPATSLWSRWRKWFRQ